MICAVCYGVLRGHQGSRWRGTFDLHFDHQLNRRELKKSADMSCSICRSIQTELLILDEKEQKSFARLLGDACSKFLSGEVLRHQMIVDMNLKNRSPLINAYLSEIYGRKKPRVYRLDFRTRNGERVGTFVLQPRGSRDKGLLDTPFSSTTSSDEVLEVAKGWINECLQLHPACRSLNPSNHTSRVLPARLIDLGAVSEDAKTAGDRDSPEQVRLVLTRDQPPTENQVYVTLSHCWGQAKFLRLEAEGQFEAGIPLEKLPKTFRDAIDFARRLGRHVRYIWIDSLCIIQGQREDWLEESAKMYEIYRNSYCNISATAAVDSSQGLYARREPRELWEDEINLNVDGIPGHIDDDDEEASLHSSEEKEAMNTKITTKKRHPIKRCSVLDLSFWERNVDDAPVNRRAWVLQERLMAPRVLHFCEDQIAWECGQFDAAESFRDGLPKYRLKGGLGGDVVLGERLKSLPKPDLRHPEPRIEVYKSWKRVVDVYSKTRLTKEGDKLIALSGIAKMMSEKVGEAYVAGLWREYLECQLLWRVDPVFKNGQFTYPSKRPQFYRAPSFSWAAVDAPQGVVYGDIIATKEDLYIEIVDDKIFAETNDKFGLVKAGYIKVKGVLKKIELKKEVKNVSEKLWTKEESTRFSWKLDATVPGQTDEWFSNVFLDSPESDLDIFGTEGRVYCLPARKDSKYLICLLLQMERKENRETGNFRRIGITKIPPYMETGQKKVLSLPDEPDIPHAHWSAWEDKHTICIV